MSNYRHVSEFGTLELTDRDVSRVKLDLEACEAVSNLRRDGRIEGQLYRGFASTNADRDAWLLKACRDISANPSAYEV